MEARKLVDELRRAEWLPRYDGEGVARVAAECRALQSQVSLMVSEVEPQDLARDAPLLTTLLALHHAMTRNKRCLLAYHQHRLERIEALLWESGSGAVDADKAAKLSERELEYADAYARVVGDALERFGLDLFVDMDPPKDHFVRVRALCDLDDVLTERGAIRLARDATLFLRRVDAEPLIRRGLVEQTD